jgi:hypothetical protein
MRCVISALFEGFADWPEGLADLLKIIPADRQVVSLVPRKIGLVIGRVNVTAKNTARVTAHVSTAPHATRTRAITKRTNPYRRAVLCGSTRELSRNARPGQPVTMASAHLIKLPLLNTPTVIGARANGATANGATANGATANGATAIGGYCDCAAANENFTIPNWPAASIAVMTD